MLKIEFSDAQVHVRVHWNTTGSVLRETVEVECAGVDLDIEIISGEDPIRVATLVRTARRGCYAEAVLSDPISPTARLFVNGKAVAADISRPVGQPTSA